MELEDLLTRQGFDTPIDVHNLTSIAGNVTRKKRRAGIYVLHFADGTCYVGKSVNVVARFRTHAHDWPLPITRVSIRWLARPQLGDCERALIRTLEAAGYRLRNKEFASVPVGPVAFDALMPVADQQNWESDLHTDFGGSRWEGDPNLRWRYHTHYETFAALPEAAEVTHILRTYVQRGIPAFRAAEYGYWACSCLPQNSGQSVKLLARININWQEVLVAWQNDTSHPIYEMQVARSPLEAAYGKGLLALRLRPFTSFFRDFQYEPGGQDQIRVQFTRPQAALDFIASEPGLQAIRHFNLNLVRKGRCNFGRSHCLDLADRLVL